MKKTIAIASLTLIAIITALADSTPGSLPSSDPRYQDNQINVNSIDNDDFASLYGYNSESEDNRNDKPQINEYYSSYNNPVETNALSHILPTDLGTAESYSDIFRSHTSRDDCSSTKTGKT